MEKEPKKLRISIIGERGKRTELGTLEWEDNRWYIYGKYKDGIKELLGERGMFYGGRTYTLKDRELYRPLLVGYSAMVVEVIE